MNGMAVQTAANYLRRIGDDFLADELEAEFSALRTERDRARDLAVQYEEQLHHATAEAEDFN